LARFTVPQRFLDRLGIGKKLSPSQLARDAMQWFQGKTARSIMSDKEKTAIPKLGKMYLFLYDAKHKDTLPYWDKQPLIIVIKKRGNSVWGLNLHYLPPTLRIKLLSQLMEYASNDRMDETTKLRVTYSFLKSASKLKEFKPTIHRYLYNHTKSQFALIPANEWKFVTMMPIAKWQGASSGTVYNDSRGKI